MANRRGSDHENAGLRIIEIREDSVCSTVLQISAPQSNSQPQFCCRRYPPIPTPPVCVEARFFEGDDFFGHQTRQHIGEIIKNTKRVLGGSRDRRTVLDFNYTVLIGRS